MDEDDRVRQPVHPSMWTTDRNSDTNHPPDGRFWTTDHTKYKCGWGERVNRWTKVRPWRPGYEHRWSLQIVL